MSWLMIYPVTVYILSYRKHQPCPQPHTFEGPAVPVNRLDDSILQDAVHQYYEAGLTSSTYAPVEHMALR